MDKFSELVKTAKAMVSPGKGILAMDEGNGTMNKRLEAVGLPPTKKYREAWREVIVTTPDMSGLGAAILYRETLTQVIGDKKTAPQILADKGVIPGVKTDEGKLPVIEPYGENLTIGLDVLSERLDSYREQGARFTKWRSEFVIGDKTPSIAAINANAYGLAVQALLSQRAGLVPMVEPEVLIKGTHDINRAYRVGQQVLAAVFEKMDEVGVYLPGTILKPSMVTPGDKCSSKASVEEVAAATVECFTEGNLVPSNLAAVAFLSGGQPELDAALHLNAMNGGKYELPTRFTFSYSRAILDKPLEAWNGQSDNVKKAQELITERAHACGLASAGKLPPDFQYKPQGFERKLE